MVRHGHSSSLYSAPPRSLAKQVERAVESKQDPTILTFTEVGSRDRTQVLREADPGWNAWVAKQSDVGIMWEKETWNPSWKRAIKLTDLVWTDGHGRKHETWAASMLLENERGQKLFVSVCHLPSHVQSGRYFRSNAQSRAWKGAVQGWNEHWVKKRRQFHPDLGMIVADWNVDFHMPVWRQRVGDYFPKLHLCWQGNMPPEGQGTHGKRLIDGTMASHKATKAILLQDDKSSDHRPYGEAIPL